MAKTYDPGQVDVIIGGYRIEGFGESSMITITRDSDLFTDKVGVDGEVSASKMYDRRAEMEITLMQTSRSNEDLQTLLDADYAAPNGAGVVGVRVVDRSSVDGNNTVFKARSARVTRDPDVSFENEASERTWKIRIYDYEPKHSSHSDF